MKADRLVRLYRWSARRRVQVWTLVNSCFDGVWLGVLDRSALARLDEGYYDDAREVLDGRAFTYTEEEHNLSGLRDWEAAVVDAHFDPGGRIVVTGAGGGREVIALLERGFDPVGYEPNRTLATAGSALLDRGGHSSRLRVCERDVFPPDVDSCDGLIIGWGSYMLIPGRDRRIAFLRAARRRVPEDAPLLCSFYVRNPDGLRYHTIVARVANVIRRIRRAEPADLGDAISNNYVHYFTRAEIEAELAAGGFRMISFAAQPYGHAVAVAEPMTR